MNFSSKFCFGILASCGAAGLLAGCTDHVNEYDLDYDNYTKSLQIKDYVFKDGRDGNKYAVAVIGETVWMAENLRYADSSKTANLEGNTWCYENDSANCEKYGRLYSWTAAMDLDSTKLTKKASSSYKAQGICPVGWRLPVTSDWKALMNYVDKNNAKESVARSLKSKTGWKTVDSISTGVDRFGFNAIGSGRHNNDGDYMEAEKFAFYWTSTESDAGTAQGWTLRYDSEFLDYGDYYKNHGLSIRCVADTSNVTFITSDSYVAPDAPPMDYGYDSVKVGERYYHTLQMDTLVWFAENMNEDMGDNWCYKDNADTCAKYGRLYSWETAKEICPEGWRLPSSNDFKDLYDFAGGANALRSTENWTTENGADTYGFTALPAGGFDGDGYFDLHSSAYFWSSLENEKIDGEAYALFLNFYSNSSEGQSSKKTYGYSVRCVKDAE